VILVIIIGCERAPEPTASNPDDLIEEEEKPLLPLVPDNYMPTQPLFGLGVELVTNAPTSITNIEFHPSNGKIYLIGLDGTIHEFDETSGQSSQILDLNETRTVRLLMDLTFHPDFLNNGKVYLAFVVLENGSKRSKVSQFIVLGDPSNFEGIDISSEVEILDWKQVTSDSHNVNNIKFGPKDGYLYVVGGDGGCCADTLNNGQNLKTLLGKTLRIDVDRQANGDQYSIPFDNPFVGIDTVNKAVFARGLRNPHRITFDELGNLFIFDVGRGRREEINFIAADDRSGPNFGWTIFEGTWCADENPLCPETRPLTRFPIFELKHPFSKAIIGGAIYANPEIPELFGQVFFGDFNLGSIWSIGYDVANNGIQNFWDISGSVIAEDAFFGSPGLVSVNNDPEGNVYFVYLSGEVYKLTSG